jgi:hypothetical protein
MNKDQNDQIRMFRTVDGILVSNHTIVLTIPGLNEAHIALMNLVGDTDVQHLGQSDKGLDKTALKQAARVVLNGSYTKVSRAAVAYGTNSKDPKEKLFKEKFRYTDTEIENMTEMEIFNNAYILYGDAFPIAAKLTPFVTVEEVEKLKQDADDYYLLLPQKRVQVSKSVTATRNLEADIFNAKKMIKDTIDPLMGPVEFLNPDFFRSYQIARHLVTTPSGKKKIDPAKGAAKS